MKNAAFNLVATVVGIQLALIFLITARCLSTFEQRCTGDRVAQLLGAVTTQVFALYAAEK